MCLGEMVLYTYTQNHSPLYSLLSRGYSRLYGSLKSLGCHYPNWVAQAASWWKSSPLGISDNPYLYPIRPSLGGCYCYFASLTSISNRSDTHFSFLSWKRFNTRCFSFLELVWIFIFYYEHFKLHLAPLHSRNIFCSVIIFFK